MPDLAIASGAVLIGAAGIWATRVHRQDHQSLNIALASPDPRVRRAALDNYGERSLASHAKALAVLAREERDPDVLAALTALVSRRQWEPLDTPALVELRNRVHRVLDDTPAPPRARNAQHDLGSFELLAAVEAALGESVRELRLHSAKGSFVLRPDLSEPITTLVNS